MAKVAVVTDSTAYIPDNLVKEYNLTIAPQVLIWGNESFKDGVDIQPDEFYTRLSKATVMPSTSQVTIPDFTKIFGELKEGVVLRPSDMIMLADSKPGAGGRITKASRGQFDANIDPTTESEWPSNRHNKRTTIMFCDGHSEAARRNDVVVLDYAPPTPLTAGNLPAHACFGLDARQVRTVIADGRVVLRDGRFTTIAKKQNIPMITFEKNLELEGVLKTFFGK